MPVFLMLAGLPASGKTTKAKTWVAEDVEHRARVNKDDLRRMLHDGVYLGAATEQVVNLLRNQAILSLLLRGVSVVNDDTNLDQAKRREMTDLAVAVGASVTFELLDVDVEECVDRDDRRANGVGVDVIREMHARYLVLASGGPPYQLPEG